MAEKTNSIDNTPLRQVREALHMKQKEFADKLSITQSYLSAVELGKKELTAKLSRKLIELFKVSPTWLMQGKGSIFRTDDATLDLNGLKHSTPENGVFDPEKVSNNSFNASVARRFFASYSFPGETEEEQDARMAADLEEYQNSPEGKAASTANMQRVMAAEAEFSRKREATPAARAQRHAQELQNKQRKLTELRDKLRLDLLKTEPKTYALTQDAELFTHLLSNISSIQQHYLNSFAEAQQNFAHGGTQLTLTPVEQLAYSEYRAAVLKEAAALEPYAEAMQAANAKMQEILLLFLPFDSSGVIEQFLLD